MSSLLERLNRLTGEDPEAIPPSPADEPDLGLAPSAADLLYDLKHKAYDLVMEGVDERAVSSRDEDRLRPRIDELLGGVTMPDGSPIDRQRKMQLVTEFLRELIGFGPIDPFLNDPTVSRINVMGPADIYVERLNRLDKVDARFRDDAHIMDLGRRIASQLNARLDEGTPMLDRKLGADGRVRIVIPPLARKGPQITIHKGLKHPFEVEEEEKKARALEREDPFTRLKLQIMERVVRDIDTDIATGGDYEQIRNQIENQIDALLAEYGAVVSRAERTQLVQETLNEMKGLGPIEPLLADPTVTEVMVNGYNMVFVERSGKIELTDVKFRDDRHVLQTIEKIVAPLGRRIDEASPMVDARLKEGPAAGSRVNAIIPPLSLKGPALTIRKFSQDPFTVNDLISFGTLTPEAAQFLDAAVKARMNCIVGGGTGSGKTTLLNVLSSFIPNDQRIVTIEDAAELQLRQQHVVTLESRPPNVEGKGRITIRDLVINSLRMRPDRIVVGECRGAEALDMLQAMNTGHDGSLTTAHANNPRELLSRIETMVLMAGMDLPLRAIREQIASAVDVIVHQSRLKDGSRRIEFITEVVGMEGEIITLQNIFEFDQEGITEDGRIVGKLKPTGIRPRCYDKIVQSGIRLPMDLFRGDEHYADGRRG